MRPYATGGHVLQSAIAFCLVASLALACGTGARPRKSSEATDTADPLPDWDYADSKAVLTATAGPCTSPPPRPGRLARARLLAWQVFSNSRLTVERALWWGEFEDPAGAPYWVVANSFRHPDESNPARQGWWLSGICDSNYQPMRVFDHRPTNADIVTIVPVPWLPPMEFHLSEAVARTETWRTVVGDEPPRNLFVPKMRYESR